MKVAIIPARGGSKRIPRKNIRLFHGQPMIAWAIAAAEDSKVFDRIVVSTDDPEVAAISREYGAEVPFVRPPEISGDMAGTNDVIIHALDWLEANGKLPEYVCCIYPCVPFITGADICEMFTKMIDGGYSTAVMIVQYAHPIWRSLEMKESGRVVYRWPKHRFTRSQDLPVMYHDAGQCYWLDVGRYRKDSQLLGDSTFPYLIPRWKAQDIDNEEDWELAHRIFSSIQKI